jgi:hypothetical protein
MLKQYHGSTRVGQCQLAQEANELSDLATIIQPGSKRSTYSYFIENAPELTTSVTKYHKDWGYIVSKAEQERCRPAPDFGPTATESG